VSKERSSAILVAKNSAENQQGALAWHLQSVKILTSIFISGLTTLGYCYNVPVY
jgi:hypothetical protein